MKKTTLSLLFTCLALLSLTACFPSGRGAQTFKGTTPDRVLSIELWTDHEVYDFGEPVNVRARLTNISGQAITLHSKSENESVLDIVIRRGPYSDPAEQRAWSQEYADDILYVVTLVPGESYELEWTQILTERAVYSIDVIWIDNSGHRRINGFSISYDVDLPM